MANAGPSTNGSQFFVVQAGADTLDDRMFPMLERQGKTFPEEAKVKYLEVGGTPWLDGAHTVFGQLIDGEDVLDAIASVSVNGMSKPLNDVVIEGISVVTVE